MSYKMYVCLSAAVLMCVRKGEKHGSAHLSLQHVSSLDAQRPVLGAVGASDGQTVSLALLLGVTGSRGRAAAASALHGHRSYHAGGPAPLLTTYLRGR